MPDPTASAVLFDIDGTLVDSNFLHIDAWSRSFADVGHPVDQWRIQQAIGRDSGELLETLLGDAAHRLGDAAKERHRQHYARDEERLRPFANADALLRELSGRGFSVVLATSAPPEEFAMLRKVLPVDEAVAQYTTSADVSTAKPAPDVVQVALQKAGVDAGEAVMVGDAVWDIRSAGAAGVRAIGVRSGGIAAAQLREAGAIEVYDDVAQLLEHLDAGPLYRR